MLTHVREFDVTSAGPPLSSRRTCSGLRDTAARHEGRHICHLPQVCCSDYHQQNSLRYALAHSANLNASAWDKIDLLGFS